MSPIERVLVAAPYPTMGGSESTFSLVRGLASAGHDVLVVSPHPSAAHRHADPGSPRGAAQLALLSAGRDRLILRLDATSLGVQADPASLMPARLALAGAVRRVPHVELILDRVPVEVSARWVSLIAGRAEKITVAADPEREALVRAGVAGSVVTVDPTIVPTTSERLLATLAGDVTPAALEVTSAEDVEGLVRRRAQEARTPAEAGLRPGRVVVASRPLRLVPPLSRPEIRSKNPAYVVVKKVQLKLFAWMFDWVIQHMNRLHQATIEAVERVEDQFVISADRGRDGQPSAGVDGGTASSQTTS